MPHWMIASAIPPSAIPIAGHRMQPFLTRVKLKNYKSIATCDIGLPALCFLVGRNGIEEPETALHPAAAGILRDALRAAARHTQILIASHSPELLDDKSISDKSIRVVSNEDGITTIAPVDEASRASIRESLYTAGELLRMDQLEPDAKNVQEQTSRQLDLFAKIAS